MAAVTRLGLDGLIYADLSGAGAAIVSSATTGTALASINESAVIAGGNTIILTLTNDTWVADDSTFAAQRQNIIDGITSAQSETTGWNNEVRDNEVVGSVARTSDTVVTVTLTAAPNYDITTTEVITVTIPAAALVTSASAIVSAPSFTVSSTTTAAFVRDIVRDITSNIVQDIVS